MFFRNEKAPMSWREDSGTSVFTWHDGKPRYDEVLWAPEAISGEEAAEIGRAKLQQDPRATRVQVAYGHRSLIEFVRKQF